MIRVGFLGVDAKKGEPPPGLTNSEGDNDLALEMILPRWLMGEVDDDAGDECPGCGPGDCSSQEWNS